MKPGYILETHCGELINLLHIDHIGIRKPNEKLLCHLYGFNNVSSGQVGDDIIITMKNGMQYVWGFWKDKNTPKEDINKDFENLKVWLGVREIDKSKWTPIEAEEDPLDKAINEFKSNLISRFAR